MVEKRFIQKLQGKDFVTHEGLLDEFHKNKGVSINTEKLDSPEGMFIFKATVRGEKGDFTGHGDADDQNVNSNIAKHKMRMAETRAVNRALRLYNNIGMCSIDELKDTADKPGEFGKDVNVPNVCSKCDAKISEREKQFSVDVFKKALCRKHQEEEKEK